MFQWFNGIYRMFRGSVSRNALTRWRYLVPPTRNDFREESDIDLVVQFGPGQRVGFIRLLSIQDRLPEIFEGRSVAMHTLREIRPVIRRQVEQQMVDFYSRRSKPETSRTVSLSDMVGACEKIHRYSENRTVTELFDDTLRIWELVCANTRISWRQWWHGSNRALGLQEIGRGGVPSHRKRRKST